MELDRGLILRVLTWSLLDLAHDKTKQYLASLEFMEYLILRPLSLCHFHFEWSGEMGEDGSHFVKREARVRPAT